MTEFTPISALLGGALLGLAALLLLIFNGQIAGVSGIIRSSLKMGGFQAGWDKAFLLGLILAPLLIGLLVRLFLPETTPEVMPEVMPENMAPVANFQLPESLNTSWWLILSGGLLVGIGTSLGSGCTSGHGLCGLGRLSPRSMVATLIFMLTAVVVVYFVRHFIPFLTLTLVSGA